MRALAALVVASMIGGAFASDVITGKAYVAFGHYRAPDGKIVSMEGKWLPFTAEKIKTAEIKPHGIPAGFMQRVIGGLRSQGTSGGGPRAMGPEALVTIYEADHQTAGNPGDYGVIAPEIGPSCSICDDIQVATTHVNKPIKQITFGFQAPIGENFLLHWTIFQSYIGGLGAGVSAVQPWPIPPTYLLDFAVWWPGLHPDTGAYKVTLDISSASTWIPTTDMWFAQRMRTLPSDTAPFDENVQNVFSHLLPPQVGTSSEFFHYDIEPDGIYDETDQDAFGDETNPTGGNLLLKLVRESTQTIVSVVPTTLTLETGKPFSGDVTDTQFEDDFYYRCRPNFRFNPQTGVILEGTSPTASPIAVGVLVQAGADSAVTLKIDMWRYRGTSPGWVQVYSGAAGPADTDVTYFRTAGDHQDFVDLTTRKVKMRIRNVVPKDYGRSTTYTSRLDMANWQITRP